MSFYINTERIHGRPASKRNNYATSDIPIVLFNVLISSPQEFFVNIQSFVNIFQCNQFVAFLEKMFDFLFSRNCANILNNIFWLSWLIWMSSKSAIIGGQCIYWWAWARCTISQKHNCWNFHSKSEQLSLVTVME